METEDWERTFREKINQLGTPPPQTQWNRARGWEKLAIELGNSPKNSSKSGRRRSVGWYYAAAVVSLLLATAAFLVNDQLYRQREEIVRLQRELTRVQTLGKYPHRAPSERMTAQPGQTQRVPVRANPNRPAFAHRKAAPVIHPTRLTAPAATPPARFPHKIQF